MALLTVKELAVELGISAKTVYRAYRNREIPAAQFRRMLMFDLREVRRAMTRRAEAMPYQRCTKRATGGTARRRARTRSPRSVKRGRNFQTARMSQRRRP